MSGKLVMGNWKMNARAESARALVAALLQHEDTNHPGVAIAPPAVYLAQVAEWLKDGRIGLGAQDVSRYGKDGAFTGEVNAQMLADVGCGYALVGHSERRQYFREDNGALLAKVVNAQAAGLTPVLCVGETLDEREAGLHIEVIHAQLEILSKIDNGEYIVAYEPVWAIGTGKVATLEQIAQMHGAIKKWCLQNTKASANIRVLYGGSVNAGNAETILATENVDGALVGGASLDAGSFRAICQAAGKLI